MAVRFIPHEKPDLAICVIGTHLSSTKKESGEKERLEEIKGLIAHEDHMSTKANAHVFLCCDLNATYHDGPGYESETYNWLVNPSNTGLKSALQMNGNELPWTSWKKRQKKGVISENKDAVDFVFCPVVEWDVTEVYGLPSEEECRESVRRMMSENCLYENSWEEDHWPGPLPGRDYPSDHLAVCATVRFLGDV